MKLYETGCTATDMASCTNLARLLVRGDNVIKDEPRAIEIFTKACDARDVGGCVELARVFKDGRGVLPNPARSDELLTRACKLGWDDKRCRPN